MSSETSNVINPKVMNTGKAKFVKRNDDGATFLNELLKDASCNERSKIRLTGTTNFIRVMKSHKSSDFSVTFDESEEEIAKVKMILDSKNRNAPKEVMFSISVGNVKEYIKNFLQQLINITLKHWSDSIKDVFFPKNEYGEALAKFKYNQQDKDKFKTDSFFIIQYGMIFQKFEGDLFVKVMEESDQNPLGEINLQPAISSTIKMYPSDKDKQYIPRWETAKNDDGKNKVVPLRLGGTDGMSTLARKLLFQTIVLGRKHFDYEPTIKKMNYLNQHKKVQVIRYISSQKFRSANDNNRLVKLGEELKKLQVESDQLVTV